jgi:hypothetical protein
MKNFLVFITGTIIVFTLLSTLLKPTGVKALPGDKTYILSHAQVDSVNQKLPIDLRLNLTANDLTPTDVVKYLLSLLGGLLASIVMYFLHKWFPKIFPSRRVNDYISPKP